MEIKLASLDEIAEKLGVQENGEVQAFFTDSCFRRMDKYVPMKTGSLRRNVTKTSDSITYESPYAHYMWYGEVMGPNIPIKNKNGNIEIWFSPKGKAKKYTGREIQYHGSPIAGAHWDSKMVTAEKEELIKEVANFAKRRNS